MEGKGGPDGLGTPPFEELTAPEHGDSPLVWAVFALTPLESSQGLLHFVVLQDGRRGSTQQISPSKGKYGSKRQGVG